MVLWFFKLKTIKYCTFEKRGVVYHDQGHDQGHDHDQGHVHGHDHDQGLLGRPHLLDPTSQKNGARSVFDKTAHDPFS